MGGGLACPFAVRDSVAAAAFLCPPDVILRFREKIEKLERDVYAVLRLEREERELQCSEAQVGRWGRGSWAERVGKRGGGARLRFQLGFLQRA